MSSGLTDHLEKDGPQADSLHGQDLVALCGIHQRQLLESRVRLLATELMLIDDGVHLHLPIWSLQDEEMQTYGAGWGGCFETQLVLHGAADRVRGVLGLSCIQGCSNGPLVAKG